MGSAQAGIYSGLGQGISGAGQAVMQALYMAQQQKLAQQQLGMQQQGLDITKANQQVQQGLLGVVDPNQVQPSAPTQPQAPPPSTSGPLSPVGSLTGNAPGVFAALQAVQRGGGPAGGLPGGGQGGGGGGGSAPSVTQGPNPFAPGPGGAALAAPSGGPPILPPGPNASGQLGGYDTSRYAPIPGSNKLLDIMGSPEMQRQLALTKAQAQIQFQNQAALKGIPEAVNPQAQSFEAQEQALRLQNEAKIAANRLKEMEDALGITQQRFGSTMASRFEKDNQQLYDTGDAYRDWQTKLAQAQSGNPADFKATTASFQRLVDQSKTGKLGMLKYLSNINPSLPGGVEQTINRWTSGQFGSQDLQNMDAVAQAVARESSAELDRRRTEEVARHSSGPGAIPGYNNIVRPSTFEGAPVPQAGAGAAGGNAANVMRWLQTP